MLKIVLDKYGLIVAAICIVFFGWLFALDNTWQFLNPKVRVVESGVTLTDELLKLQIGQMIMIGFRGIDAPSESTIAKLIRDVQIGGVILFDYDAQTRRHSRNIVSPEQVKNLILDLQKNSKIPLFVALDAEGGSVHRLAAKAGFLSIPAADELGKMNNLKVTEQESFKLAKELKSLGINMNLAPVIDLNLNPNNPAIGALGRSFSKDPNEVIDQAEVFIQSHRMNNIITVVKHFPGLGSAKQDPHLETTNISNEYDPNELKPFEQLNRYALLDAVMVTHVVDDAIDNTYPATLSSAFLNGILRGQIGFKGVIVADDLQMAAITKNYKFENAVIKAINAGCDVLIISNNTVGAYSDTISYEILDFIFNAVKDKKIERHRISDAYDRILQLKEKFGIDESN